MDDIDDEDEYELRFLDEGSVYSFDSDEDEDPFYDPDLLTPVPDTDQNENRRSVQDSWRRFADGDPQHFCLCPKDFGPASRSFFWRKIGQLPIEERPKSFNVCIDTQRYVTNTKQAQFVPDLILHCRADVVKVETLGWFDDTKFVDGMKSVTCLRDLTVNKDAAEFVDFSAWLELLDTISLKRVCFEGPAGEEEAISNQNGVYQAPMPSLEHQVYNALSGRPNGDPLVLVQFCVNFLYIHDLAALAHALSPCKLLLSAQACRVLGPGASSSAEFGTTLLSNHPLLEEIFVSSVVDGLTIHNGWDEFAVALSKHPRIKSISFYPFDEESCLPNLLRVCGTKMLLDVLHLGSLVCLEKKDEHYELEISSCDEALLQAVASFNTKVKINIDLGWMSPSVPYIKNAFPHHSSCMVTKLSLGFDGGQIGSVDLGHWAEGLMDYEKLTELKLHVQDDAMVTAFCPQSSLEHLDISIYGRSAAAEDCPLASMMLFEHPTLECFILYCFDFGSQVAQAVRVHPNMHSLKIGLGVSGREQHSCFLKLLFDNVLGYNQHLVELEVDWNHPSPSFNDLSFFASNLHRVKFLDKLDVGVFFPPNETDSSLRAREEKLICGLRNNYSITSVSYPLEPMSAEVPGLLLRNKLLSVKRNVPFSLWPRGIIQINSLSAEGDDATPLFTLLQQSEHIFWHALQRTNQKRKLSSDSA